MNGPDRYAILSHNVGPCSLQHANSAAAQRFQENSEYGLEMDKRHTCTDLYSKISKTEENTSYKWQYTVQPKGNHSIDIMSFGSSP